MELIKRILFIVTFLCCVAESFAQKPQVVSGTVSEMINNKRMPLPTVNVSVVNAQNRTLAGTVTNANGNYNLTIPAGQSNLELVFSFIGMKSKRVKYTGQVNLNMVLQPDETLLQTVEIKAERPNDMGITTRQSVSATQKVNMDDLVLTSPVVSFEEALQGQLGGVDIVTGGDPGARSAIQIRGQSSLIASSNPLIVIDGVPYTNDVSDDFNFSTANEDDLGSLLNISPVDIESIEVLKDASATAIWGTKGANGVLMITTKRGKVGKTRFSFNSKYTGKTQPKTIPMLNGNEYTALMQDAIWNSVNYLGAGNNDYLRLLFDTPEIGYDQNWRYFDEYNQNTDWLSQVTQTAYTLENNIAMSGGGAKATYRFSGGLLNDDGTTIGTHLRRITTTANINYQFSNKLRFGADFSYVQADRDDNWASTVRSEAFGKMPNKAPFFLNESGDLTDQYFTYHSAGWEGTFRTNTSGSSATNYNPVAMVNEATNTETERARRLTIRTDYNISKSLTYKAYAAIAMQSTNNMRFLPREVTGVTWFNPNSNLSSDNYAESLSILTENRLSYIKSWSKEHTLVANAIFRTTQGTGSYYESTVSGLPSSEVSDPVISPNVTYIRSGESQSRSYSMVGLVNYSLLNRYSFQVSLNSESSSAMGRNQRIGYFPGAGLAWNIQDEPWLKRAKETWLTQAKLRLGVGRSGRAPKGNSIYLGAFSSGGNYMDMPTIHPIRMQLDNLKWENSTEFNYGLDFAILNNRFRFTADYYEKYASDLLRDDVRIPSTTGFDMIEYYNSGKIENRGFEFRTDVTLYTHKDWQVTGFINTARNSNKITEMPINMTEQSGVAEADANLNNGIYAIRNIVGQPTGAFYGYRFKGVYSTKEDTYARDAGGNIMNDINGMPIIMRNGNYTTYPGDAAYEDINNDGVINKYDIVYLGNSNPTLTGGAGISVRYKKVSVNAFFHGRFGQSVVNTTRMSNEAMYGKRNQSTAVLRRWRNEGDVTDIPRALYNEGLNYLGSDRFVEDASFLRLKTLTVNYTFPGKLINRLGVSSLSAFVSGYNLYTWTSYTGQDPEVSIKRGLAADEATTPVSMRFACGINMNF